MEGNVTKDGILMVERGVKWVYQICSFNENRCCGDTCPLFLEEDGRVFPCGNKNVVIDIMKDERYL